MLWDDSETAAEVNKGRIFPFMVISFPCNECGFLKFAGKDIINDNETIIADNELPAVAFSDVRTGQSARERFGD